jgi:hypothetical protein
MCTAGTLVETQRTFVLDALDEKQLNSTLPFRVKLRAVDADRKDVACKAQLMVSAVSSRTCFAEGFERKSLGRW